MKALTASGRRAARVATALALAFAAILSASGARAQQNPLRGLTNALGWTATAGDGPDFVRDSRPDTKTMGFSNLTGVDKKRVPVKTPDQLKADQAALISDREKADAQRKKLEAVKVDPVAPTKVAPIEDE
ncbi:hypothetical protein K9U39_05110 [Rhodoblastus acidophilus]|uniref:Uncharacterized protein n=1 Tax=Candidatus Rhodoblastus alkanivorans TaxID=2954117 RepID=A0ABS9Z5Y0_9HYPH|nr:hypothetical protein [Candidatus Rhodoblastus alkanivorans]MCI4678611.1 hypothetical protein [Candidatus Rhodoblastus alkanivorans]MCI4683021.1 hypothetical protein [Candidatus Rhodoblastus alkanivorans]MDI4640331.1 hypothetical protein [Rhodoblastus acidophilus]